MVSSDAWTDVVSASTQQIAGRELTWFTATGEPRDGSSVEDETSRALAAAMAAIDATGLSADAIVRSRVRATTSEDRISASGVRHAVLSGPRRAASSSFVDVQGVPAGRRVAVDLAVLATPDPVSKDVAEREPPVASCSWVEVDGLSFMTGLTHAASSLTDQVEGIVAAFHRVLARTGLTQESVQHVTIVHTRDLDAQDVRAAVRSALPLPEGSPWVLVDGLSSADKNIEIELTLVGDRP
jgi:enamine deaminase RidA (YjgF/YER057c/UK114 family)